ncbi:MAG: hypothetical protein RR395_08120, partial [Ruthenibacterium sp.]
KSTVPSYIRMADLLEDVFVNPPRDTPFSPPFKPHFNALKYCALLGVHALYALHCNPQKISAFAGRIYGYVDKAHLEPAEIARMEAKIKRFVS